jgi:hypothetical protein
MSKSFTAETAKTAEKNFFIPGQVVSSAFSAVNLT